DVFITGPSSAKPDLLADELNEKGIEANSLATGTSPTDQEIDEAVANAEEAEKIIVTTYTANTNEAQEQLVHEIEATGKPVTVAAIRNPYDLMVFPEVDGYLTTYGFQDVSVKALANVIAGDVNPFGKLPVTIPDLYDYGHGLDYVDTPQNADGMKTLAETLMEEGEIEDDRTARSIDIHLTSVSYYEKKDLAEKVVKHMESFKQLLDHHKENEMITAKAHSYLMTETDQLIEKWSTEQ